VQLYARARTGGDPDAQQADRGAGRRGRAAGGRGPDLDAVAGRLGVDRRTILRWVERDPAFRARYGQARRLAHRGLYRELQEAIGHASDAAAAYAARRRLMRRVPKRHGQLPPELRPCLLYRPRPRRADEA
jgi:hypothetical protein